MIFLGYVKSPIQQMMQNVMIKMESALKKKGGHLLQGHM